MLAKELNPDLKVYLAWVPMFRGMERDVPKASASMPDLRTSHYWDGESLLGKGYRKTLGITEDAWDIFVLYGPEARWDGGEPPAPAFWMHQLGSARSPRVDGPYLDTDLFLEKTRELLATSSGH